MSISPANFVWRLHGDAAELLVCSGSVLSGQPWIESYCSYKHLAAGGWENSAVRTATARLITGAAESPQIELSAATATIAAPRAVLAALFQIQVETVYTFNVGQDQLRQYFQP